MPRTAQQFENIREEKKSLIMNTALELFAVNGYHATTISSIARSAGISKGLLYNYFESKDELIRAILFNGLESIDKIFDSDNDGVLTREEMEYFLDQFFKFMKDDLHFWKLYFTLFVQPPVIELINERFQEVIQKAVEILTGFFKSLGHEDPDTEALIFGSMLDGIGMNFITNPDLFPVEKTKKRILEIFCK